MKVRQRYYAYKERERQELVECYAVLFVVVVVGLIVKAIFF